MMEQKIRCTTCDGQTLKRLTEAGMQWLGQNHERVNQLNVFPIPDGDTGINMLLTMQNAYQEAAHDENNNVAHIARRIAHGAIMGSRGNSGTITSRIWSGFAQGLGVAEVFDVPLAVQALREAANTAYRGVQHPTEGTILTVIREVAEEAEAQKDQITDLVQLLEKLVARGWDAVSRTPDMLPVLKMSGVVDSGGSGLMYIIEGMLKYLRGEDLGEKLSIDQQFEQAIAAYNLEDVLDPGESPYNYDVQFVIKGENLNPDLIKTDIEAMGDSAVIVGNEVVVKVHVHVDDPGIPISYAVKYGTLAEVVVENMQDQYETYLKARQAQQKKEPLKLRAIHPGEIGVVAVVPGEGIARAFADLGIAALVSGGQTNNPSNEEILKAVRSLNTDKVIVLPNNKNILLTAQHAAEMVTDIQMKIIPTRTVPQGIAAMLPYRPDGELDNLVEEMTGAKDDVTTAEITRATRTVEIDGVAVQEGQVIGLIDGKLRVAGDEIQDVIQQIMAQIDLDDYGLVTLYYGEDVQKPEAEALAENLQETYSDLEFQVVPGGQPHYYYIIGIE